MPPAAGGGERPPLVFRWSRANNSAAGSGALLRLEGEGCGELLRGVQPWILAPRRISTADLSATPPVDGGVGTEIYVRTMEDSARRAANPSSSERPVQGLTIWGIGIG